VPDLRDRIVDDAPVLLVSQALPDQFLGHRDRQLADLASEFFARATHVGVQLGPRRIQEPLRLGARGLHEAPLLVRRLLQRLGADRGGFGVSRTLDKMGMRASDTAELSFSDMRVPAENLLGREGVGFYEVMRVFQRERLVAGLHAVAMAERALEDTIAYVRERQAFGGPLSDKQAVRHRLAEMATDIEAGRWLTYAAWQKYAAGEEVVREVSMVKLFTAEMVNRVAYGCVQLHGGYGYMREYPVERFARDARLMTIGGGTSEIMKDIIAKALVR